MASFLIMRLFFLISLLYIDDLCSAMNPYHVLGVSRSATIPQIKRSYKNLAKKYHPDKNQNIDANDKFIELNKAYEILMDPERRRLYDKTKQTEDSPNFKPHHDYNQFDPFDFDSFSTLFNSKDGRGFRFTFNSGNFFRQHSITHRTYENTILPQSYSTPYILRSLPKNLITEIDDFNYLSFLNGWTDNKVRVMFINSDRIIKLRYTLIAFYFHDRAAFGRVKIDAKSQELLKRYRIDTKMNSLIVFNEEIANPIASLHVNELKTQIMKDLIDSNKYLLLPRITSQNLFDHLCPVANSPSRAKLCVMMILNERDYNEAEFEEMRNFMKANDFSKDRFGFMYIFKERQVEFVKALIGGANSKIGSINRGIHVVILWRKESNTVYYEWLDNEWILLDSIYINETKHKLGLLINKLSQNTAQFPFTAKLSSLTDEDSKSLLTRIVKRLLLVTENFSDNISRTNPTPILSIAFSILFIIFIGYVMTYLMKIEEESIQEKYRKLGRQVPGSTHNNRSSYKSDYKLNIHELRGETYNGLIRLLKPGCRTIVLLCDNPSKPKLLPQFYKAVHPYRKNKTLMFAFLLVEKNIDWYKKLLLQALGDDRDLQINPKNCIGTVISINGFRKYFCVYHAKHPESNPVN
ncbi:dnaJ domain containing protein 2 [Sarcoptes scabiei]|uniref:DnaJ domain containing protein 2 n=1 Tax=Sarcoptes scabiei TaxID=52283 RepID=A0A132ACA5_SARSC|nr:dnaJ domain containing protein 2 [Sarcoptes scabiei]